VCICLWPCLSVLGAKLRSICAVLHPHFRVGGSFVIQFVVLSSRHALLLCDVHSQCLSVCDCHLQWYAYGGLDTALEYACRALT